MSVSTNPAITGVDLQNYGQSAAFASLLPGQAAGQRAWCTSGAQFPVVWNGTRWISDNSSVLYSALSAEVTGAASVSEQVIRQVLLPANFLAAGYVIDMDQQFSKSGSTDNCIIKVRIGTAGTTADALILTGTAAQGMQASGRTTRWTPKIRIVSATAVSASVPQSTAMGSSTTAWPADVSISNISNALYITTTITMGGTTDTVTLKSSETYIERT